MEKSIDFVAVGPLRTGTTWLYEYLKSHPQVCVPIDVKELFFYNINYEKGFQWYYSHFPSCSQNKLMGEVSPTYFHSEKAPERIYDVNPKCLILITLRNPLDRLISHYFMLMNSGDLNKDVPIVEAINKQPILLEISRYYHHLCRWTNVFENNAKILFYDSLEHSTNQYAIKICNALNISYHKVPDYLNKQIGANKKPKSYIASKLAFKVKRTLRNNGLHKIVEFLKYLGIKNLLYTEENSKNIFDMQDLDYILDFLYDDIKKLENNFLLNLDEWNTKWDNMGLRK